MSSDGRYAISPWTAEFRDRDTERLFQEHNLVTLARQVKWTLLAVAIFFFLFSVMDYVAFGFAPITILLIAFRFVVVLASVWGFYYITRTPLAAATGVPVSAFELLLVIATGVALTLRDDTLSIYAMCVTTLLTGIYLCLHNRLPYVEALAVLCSVGFLAVAPRLLANLEMFTNIVLLLTALNVFGLLAARRLAIDRREQYRQLARSEETREELHREVQRRREAEAELAHLAATDPLTNLLNRRRFFELGTEELERARRHKRPLALLMIDVDHFKTINDAWGHAAGDETLQYIAETLRRQLRTNDLVARLGGEEFALLLPETDLAAARRMGTRLCGLFSAAAPGDTPSTAVSITVGVAASSQADTIERMLARADQAMLEGKRAGRGRVVTQHHDARGEPDSALS